MSRILLTGATGALGQLLVPRLLEDGHEVACIIREKPSASSKMRAQRLFGEQANELVVIPGDLLKLPRVSGSYDKIVHCAASLSFNDAAGGATRRTNVGGTAAILKLAENLEVGEVHCMSTSYVGGDADRFREDETYIGQRFRNPYEASKFVTEECVRTWSEITDIPFSIYRFGILIGGSNGETTTFDGYYGYFKPVSQIKQALLRKLKSGNRLPLDIAFNSDEDLCVPLRFPCSSDSTINLVPLDWAVDILAKLIDCPSRSLVYHLVHPRPPKVKWVIERSLQHLGIYECDIGENARSVSRVTSELVQRLQQRRLDPVLDLYDPYVTHEPVFEAHNAMQVLGEAYCDPSPINQEFLFKLLDYAEQVNWGMGQKEESLKLAIAS